MNFFPTPLHSVRRLCGLLLGLLLFTQSAQAFFLFPQFLIVFSGENSTVDVNGPPGGHAMVVISSITGFNSSVVTYSAPNGMSGAGTVPIIFTGVGPGSTSASFFGTYNGNIVSASLQILVLPH